MKEFEKRLNLCRDWLSNALKDEVGSKKRLNLSQVLLSNHLVAIPLLALQRGNEDETHDE